MSSIPFQPPTVTDADIVWASHVMRLPSTAFAGPGGQDPRVAIIRSTDSLDIEACPGSGKTTLLVAKLAILARKWTDRRRGICVLSHTNVARREIEERLGGVAEGRRLLSYPHFVGTIHGFVNTFMASPWVRSKPYPIKRIDDDVCQSRRWARLKAKSRFALEKQKRTASILKIVDSAFSVGDVPWGKGKLDATGELYADIRAACKAVSEEGYFCYDEMFVWASELLSDVSRVSAAIRMRFPLLFLDEVQDNSELQSVLLHRLFVEGGSPVVRQRFGDSNQAIFQHAGQADGAITDRFPVAAVQRDLPNSHRFGQEIASLADRLAPVPQGLLGCGPPTNFAKCDTAGKHAIFLFEDATICDVLPAYARHLLSLFTAEDLKTGTFTAVGAVHRRQQDKDDKVPRSVAHYWPDYDHQLTVADAVPQTLIQCVASGGRLLRLRGAAHHQVQAIAEALLRLVEMLNSKAVAANRHRAHQHVLGLIGDRPELRVGYLRLVAKVAGLDDPPSKIEWTSTWLPSFERVAQSIAGVYSSTSEAKRFLAWSEPSLQAADGGLATRDNIFRYPESQPAVRIRVGSIHSAKGETHTATLVLETYYYQHSLQSLKPWILGLKSGKGKENSRTTSRLRQHYVAVTRPSHLLCLAMREDALTPAELVQLSKGPWRVARVLTGGTEWLS